MNQNTNNYFQTSYGSFNWHFSASTLRILAILFMIIDHIGAYLLYNFQKTSIATLMLYKLLRAIGRLSFPLFVFLLIQGFEHSHNRKSYLLRLIITACISEPFFDYAGSRSFFNLNSQNTIFTLALILIMFLILEYIYQNVNPQILKIVLSILTLVITIAIGHMTKIDYGEVGPLYACALLLLSGLIRQNPSMSFGYMLILVFASSVIKHSISHPDLLCSSSGLYTILSSAMEIQLFSSLSVFIISAYDGTKGLKLPKKFCYAIYPAQLIIFALIKYFLI